MEATPRIENKTDKYLTKSPHNTNEARVALVAAAQKAVVETLERREVDARDAVVYLGRTKIVVSRKTTCATTRVQGASCAHGCIRCPSNTSLPFTHLV